MSSGSRVAIIGAGPAGLAAAYRLASGEATVEIFEAGPHLGGIARSIELWGRAVDLGPHIFYGGDRRVLELWRAIIGADGVQLPIRRGIVTHGRVLEYPIRPLDALMKLPIRRVLRGVLDCVAARWHRGRRAAISAEDWIVHSYGRALYDELARSYIEKLWGRPGGEIDAVFVRGLFGAPAAGASAPAGAEVAGATFLYPRGGASSVWSRMRDRMSERVTIHCNTPVEAIAVQSGRVTGIHAGRATYEVDRVISTMPLPRLVRTLRDVPSTVVDAARQLQTRHVVIVYLLVRQATRLPHLWLYAYDERLRLGRVSDHRNWAPREASDPESIFTMEYWCSEGDDIWSADDTHAIAIAAADLHALEVVGNCHVVDGRVSRVRGALPVPTLDHAAHLATIRRHVDAIQGLATIGRHGAFAFSSMTDVMGAGIDAADRVLDQKNV